MTEKKNKQNLEKKKGFWWWILVIIAFIIILNALDKPNKLNDYTYCVDDCIYNVQNCMFSYQIYDDKGHAYIQNWDADSCVSELKSCVSDCESDYGS